MAVSRNSTSDEELDLLKKLWEAIKFAGSNLETQKSPTNRPIPGRMKCDLSYKELADIKEVMVLAAHRLAFLEMVVKGLSYMEQHDAQAYAKFIEQKRNLEDLDLNELRVLMR